MGTLVIEPITAVEKVLELCFFRPFVPGNTTMLMVALFCHILSFKNYKMLTLIVS